jgi:hypothetical protein
LALAISASLFASFSAANLFSSAILAYLSASSCALLAAKSDISSSTQSCDNNNFDDPLPGRSKQCFCDQDGYYRHDWVDEDMSDFAAKRAQEEAER